MDIQQILFWFLTAVALGCALGVIFSRNPINSVICLILTFFTISGHYILMNAQFLAIVNIIVYAGAIMVLFLFVIMLMNLNADTEPQKSNLVRLAGALSGGALFVVIIAALRQATITTPMETGVSPIGLIENLGKTLFTDYVLPFEISSVLFLSAMIGAIVIGKREEAGGPDSTAIPRQSNQN